MKGPSYAYLAPSGSWSRGCAASDYSLISRFGGWPNDRVTAFRSAGVRVVDDWARTLEDLPTLFTLLSVRWPHPFRRQERSGSQYSSIGDQEEDAGWNLKCSGSQPSVRGPAENFTGNVRVDPLFQAPCPGSVSGAYVTFEPGARSAWHTYPLGQTLIVTATRRLVSIWSRSAVRRPA